MDTKQCFLENLTYQEVEKTPKDKTILIIPMGPLEAHGPHLPLGTDFFGAQKLSQLIVEKLSNKDFLVQVAPLLPYTLADVAMPFAGTVTLRRETLLALLSDIIQSFAKHGYKYFVLLCNHLERPNLAVLHEASQMLTARSKIAILVSNTLLELSKSPSVLLKGEYPQWDFHAGEAETSFCLWAYPELVKKEILASLKANWSNIREKFQKGAKDFVEAGGPLCYFGDPAKGSALVGEKLYERLSGKVAEEITTWFYNQIDKS